MYLIFYALLMVGQSNTYYSFMRQTYYPVSNSERHVVCSCLRERDIDVWT